MFEIVKNGLFKEVRLPVYGQQDMGVTPGGAMDQFSLQVGNALLGIAPNSPAYEMIIPPKLKLTQDGYFVLTGAGYNKVTITAPSEDAEASNIAHGTVCFARAGSVIKFGRKLYGLRTYLCYTPATEVQNAVVGRAWDEFEARCDCTNPETVIRVVEGPEYGYLDDPERFLSIQWTTTIDISEMGMKLGCEEKMPTVSLKNMVSEPVSDGTIQMTPKGPIILMRHRQTVGGYPRIFNVISADVDRLAHYSAKKPIRFQKVSLTTAVELIQQKRHELNELTQQFTQ